MALRKQSILIMLTWLFMLETCAAQKGKYFPYNIGVFKMLYVVALFVCFFQLVVLSCVCGATGSLRFCN